MKTVLILTLISLFLHADTFIPPKAKDVAITVYNNNLAFVHESRITDVTKGVQKLIYEGIPSKVITQSVIPSFKGCKVTLYSQNYIYNLITLSSLLQKSIDKKVTYYTNGENPSLEEGILLAATPSVIVKNSINNKIYTLNTATQVVFSQIPPSMITKPSLVWHINASDTTALEIDLKYLSRDISWKSDYVLDLNKKVFDLTGWITITNNSGASYENATIHCIAGDLHRIVQPRTYSRNYKTEAVALDAMPVHEESFSGYHLYKIPFKESIRNKEQKQILFIDKKDIKYEQYGKCINSYFENYGTQKLHFDNIITFINRKKDGLGIPLPAGAVRMYQSDSSKNTHYIGEDHLDNTPAEEQVKLTVGRLFDIAGEKKITKFISKRKYREVETTYILRNQGKSASILKIEERIPTYGDKITLHSSCKENCSIQKINAFAREFTIVLQPEEKYRFTSGFEVIY
jgi:hypothetical protein